MQLLRMQRKNFMLIVLSPMYIGESKHRHEIALGIKLTRENTLIIQLQRIQNKNQLFIQITNNRQRDESSLKFTNFQNCGHKAFINILIRNFFKIN